MTDKKLDPADLAAITGRTLNHYDRFAESFWEGTRDHDVSQNIDALLQHIGADPPFTLLDSAVAWQRVNRYNYINHID